FQLFPRFYRRLEETQPKCPTRSEVRPEYSNVLIFFEYFFSVVHFLDDNRLAAMLANLRKDSPKRVQATKPLVNESKVGSGPPEINENNTLATSFAGVLLHRK